MHLSREIPARREIIQAKWCKKDFIKMGKEVRKARQCMRDPMDKCYWCGHKFIDGEMMALACLSGEGNKILCQNCAAQLESSAEDKTE